MKLTCPDASTFLLDNFQQKNGKDVDITYQCVDRTAGNVMIILAWYGWHTLIATRLDNLEDAIQMKSPFTSRDICSLSSI